MATKKQKREAGEARAAIHRAESIASGLRAQKRDREIRAKKAKDAAVMANSEKNKKVINGMKAVPNGHLAAGS